MSVTAYCSVEICKNIYSLSSIAERDYYIFNMIALCLADIPEYRNSCFSYSFFMFLVLFNCFCIQLVGEGIDIFLLEILTVNFCVKSECNNTGKPESFIIF